MRFLHRDNTQKTILVFSDLHLGAGTIVGGKRNCLEDFHYDKELVDFLRYYSEGDYAERDVELVINGDFIDFLAIPFVPFFDDEFWSERAALEKLKLSLTAHHEVMEALVDFVCKKKKNLVYILGNHDAEFIFDSCRQHFLSFFGEEGSARVLFHMEEEYLPTPGVVIKHGHTYEVAHTYDVTTSLIKSAEGENYFLAPWGSYYVTRVVNKFKQERNHINQVKPIPNFLIHGVMFDTLFTLRFMFSTAYYFFMVRFIYFFLGGHKLSEIMEYTKKELSLFQNLDSAVEDYFEQKPETRALIVGHNHTPDFKIFPQGNIFVNTGTWTEMYNLDFSSRQDGARLTYAQVDVKEGDMDVNLFEWVGPRNLPFSEFA